MLKLGGTTAAVVAGGFSAVSTASNHLPGSTTVDLGNQGLDPGDDIQPMVDNYLADDTNVIIPGDDSNPIQYTFNDDITGTYSDAALVGDGMVELVRSDGVTRVISLYASGGDFVLGNITSIGEQGAEDEKWRARATNGGSLTIQNVHQPDGAEGSEDGGPDVASGWYVKRQHSGDLTFCDCSAEGFPDNGFYASAPNADGYIADGSAGEGPVYFRGCVAKNNNVSGIRIGTDNSEVTDCVIINDAQAPPTDGAVAMRGFRVRNPGDNIYVENLHIDYPYDGAGAAEPWEIHDGADGGSLTANDVVIRTESDSNAINDQASSYSLSGDDLDITGGGNHSYAGSWTNVCTGSGCESPNTTPPSTDCGPLGSGDTTAPSAPTNLSSPSHTATTVDLDWDGVSASDLDHYYVYVDGNVDHQVSSGTTSTTVDALSASTSYDFEVTAVDTSSNESGTSNLVSVTTDSASQVAEDFSHNDVPGTYRLDTGAFTTSTTRSTSDSYSLQPNASSDANAIILRGDMVTTAGNTYTFDVYFPSGGDNDMGFLFGAQDGITGKSDYTGYHGLLDTSDDELRLEREDDGSTAVLSSSSATFPTSEWLTVELDFRDSGSDIVVTVYDASDSQVVSASLSDTTHDSGGIGWYNWFASADWYADTWVQGAFSPSTNQVAEDFSHDDVAGTYSLDTGAFTTSGANSTTDAYSLQADAGSDANSYIQRDDMVTTAGNTYTLDVYFPSTTDNDVGFTFAAQGGVTGWGDYTGYFFILDTGDDEIRLQREDAGSTPTSNSTSTSFPAGEWLTVELDFRDSGSDIVVTVFDVGGSQVASVSLSDSTHNSGGIGFYNWFAAADWHVDSWFNAANEPAKVIDNFSHDDVSGTYSIDTGSFTTSSTRSTSDSYSLQADDSSDSNELILREDKSANAGNTYELDVYFPSSSDNDVGVAFAAQDGITGWGDYVGYFFILDTGDDEIRLQREDASSTPTSNSTSTSFPAGEWLTVELDFRDSGSDIVVTVYDASDSQIASVSLSDSTHDSGGVGFYNWFDAADWHVDSWTEQ